MKRLMMPLRLLIEMIQVSFFKPLPESPHQLTTMSDPSGKRFCYVMRGGAKLLLKQWKKLATPGSFVLFENYNHQHCELFVVHTNTIAIGRNCSKLTNVLAANHLESIVRFLLPDFFCLKILSLNGLLSPCHVLNCRRCANLFCGYSGVYGNIFC